jgi:hypothetical protein
MIKEKKIMQLDAKHGYSQNPIKKSKSLQSIGRDSHNKYCSLTIFTVLFQVCFLLLQRERREKGRKGRTERERKEG